MGDNSSQLLCTFINITLLDDILNQIQETYTIIYKKIFVFYDMNLETDLYCTYNIDGINSVNAIPNTIVLHRKKITNTLYTINALNELIKSLNNGIQDCNYQINWNDYTNNLILFKNFKLKIIQLKIKDIICV